MGDSKVSESYFLVPSTLLLGLLISSAEAYPSNSGMKSAAKQVLLW
jgi:hypothetical protein